MKIQQRLAASLAALLIIFAGFPAFTAKANELQESEESLTATSISANELDSSSDVNSSDEMETPTIEDSPLSPDQDLPETESAIREEASLSSDIEPQEGESCVAKESSLSPDQEIPEAAPVTALCSDVAISAIAPAFDAYIEYAEQGYRVMGVLAEFYPDTVSVRPQYSLDKDAWHDCVMEWNLNGLGSANNSGLQKQACLHVNQEPFKSYLAGKIDRFYLRLHIVRENGISYDSQTAMIERGEPQPLPDDIQVSARFAPSLIVKVRETNPIRFYSYGKYQLTISADASAEDVTAMLPNSLPVEIMLQKEGQDMLGIAECPVTWKSLSLPRLTAGESIIVQDAAEEIVVPAGTLVNSPWGIFRLDNPLSFDQNPATDEVRLVLNVVEQGAAPTGVLCCENEGLKMAFSLKPTGATSIRAYTFCEGASEWTPLADLPFLEAASAQLSTANSGYTLVLDNSAEPYRSYLAAEKAGDTPSPFLVGLKIEGGVYNGQQLILPWPNTYPLPPHLPSIGGSGGNESNAGSGNKNDSTPEGQRPDLPQDADEEKKEQAWNISRNTQHKQEKDSSGFSHESQKEEKEKTADVSLETVNAQAQATPDLTQNTQENTEEKQQDRSQSSKKQQDRKAQEARQETAGSTAKSDKKAPDKPKSDAASAKGLQEYKYMPEESDTLLQSPVTTQYSNHTGIEENSTMVNETAVNARHSHHGPLLPVMTAAALAAICVTAISAKMTGGGIIGKAAKRILHVLHKQY